MKINILDEAVYSKIAAGEIIDKPASIVRELVDNSIDAHATKIDIRLKNGGINQITITDDGDGMSKDDLELATLKHTTSKIKTIDDIYTIKSMGFRGEALYSIKTVSIVTITSSNSSSGTTPGYTLSFVDTIQKIEETASNKGTKIDIKDLFYNLPARRKFLKSSTTELNSIKSTLIEKIFSNLHIAFNVYNDDKLVFRTNGNGSFNEAFFCVYKNENPFEISPFTYQHNDSLSIMLYHSEKEIFFNTKKYQVVFVNNRPINCPFFYSAAATGYSDYISPGRNPLIYLFIDIDPQLIDVNIHPAKREVKFYDQQIIYTAIMNAVKAAFSNSVKSGITGTASNDYSSFFIKENHTPHYGSQNSFIPKPHNSIEGDLLDLYHTHKSSIISERSNIPFAHDTSVSDFKIIGTLFSTYITVEKDNKVYFIDQHAVEESHIFKKKKELFEKNPGIDNLLIPFILELDITNDFINKKIVQLNEVGFTIEENEGNTFTIRSLPSILNAMNISIVKQILKEWLEESEISDRTIIDGILIKASCREAVKKGDSLSPLEIKNLVEIFFNEEITNCPHGRPVFFELSKDNFEKNFQRKK